MYSRQSTRLFLQSSELGPPPPLVPGGTHSIAGERGRGGPNSDEGRDTVVFIHVLCGFGETLVTELLLNKLFAHSIQNSQPHPVLRFDILFSVVGSNWLCKVRGGEGQRQTIHPRNIQIKMFIQISSLRAWVKILYFTNQDQGESYSSRGKASNRNLTLCVYQLMEAGGWGGCWGGSNFVF